MISTEEAEKIIQNSLPSLGVEETVVEDSVNRVIAEDIFSPEDSPRFSNSAMDGFAVCWNDVSNVADGEKSEIRIIGESSAGIPYKDSAGRGEGIRISTGAVIPEIFDTIIPVEDCDFDGKVIKVNKLKKLGQHVRVKGEEFTKGDLLIEKGKVVDPAVIALLTLVGIEKIKSFRIPKVSIITTGSELIRSGAKLDEGEIRDSNTPMLKTLIKLSGAVCSGSYTVKDSLDETIDIIKKAEKNSDVIIFSGGVSVGSHDHVKEASIESGFTELFWRIKQKPGKPLFFAKKDEKLLFGLPGNPVSSLMNYVKYLHPAILMMSGKSANTNILNAKAGEDVTNSADRTNLLRVQINRSNREFTFFTPIKQESHMLTSVSNSDGFISVKPGGKISKGELTEVYLFPWKD